MISAPDNHDPLKCADCPKQGLAILMTDNQNHHPNDALIDEDITKLVERLNVLKEGEQVVAALVHYGPRAIKPLRQFLFDGRPSSVYHPRQRAVRVLAALGAQDILIEYLTREKNIPDPIDRYGEEAVEGTAARLIARWRTDAVYAVLLQLLRTKPLPGLIDAISEFHRTEPIPELITCLGDSICWTFAEKALRRLGQAAYRELLVAARRPDPSEEYESPSSLCRRRSVLRLLAELEVSAEDWPHLSPLQDDRDPEIVIRVCRIALAVPQENENILAVRRLVGMLGDVPWFLRIEMEGWLVDRFERTMAVIEKEMTARRPATNLDGPMDEQLRWLHALKERLTRYHNQ